ncbi:MAG: putative signal transducing protein [Anaerolineae bacterium]
MTDDTAGDLVTVFYSQGPLAAEVAKSKLEVNGITAILRYQSVGRVFALTVDGLGLVEVLVSASDADRAREVLADTSETSSDESS